MPVHYVNGKSLRLRTPLLATRHLLHCNPLLHNTAAYGRHDIMSSLHMRGENAYSHICMLQNNKNMHYAVLPSRDTLYSSYITSCNLPLNVTGHAFCSYSQLISKTNTTECEVFGLCFSVCRYKLIATKFQIQIQTPVRVYKKSFKISLSSVSTHLTNKRFLTAPPAP
jgi:hypothetical protein